METLEGLRRRLVEMIGGDPKKLTDPQVVRLSQELDSLIGQQMETRRQAKMTTAVSEVPRI